MAGNTREHCALLISPFSDLITTLPDLDRSMTCVQVSRCACNSPGSGASSLILSPWRSYMFAFGISDVNLAELTIGRQKQQ